MAAPAAAARPKSLLDRLIDALAVLAGAMLCVLTVIVCLDVGSRTLRLFAMPWTLDVTEYLLYAITFLAAPWVLREQGHIAIEIVVERLPRRMRTGLQRFTDAIGALVCAVLFVYACRVWWRSYSQGNVVHETFVFPEWYLYTLAPPVFLILAVEFAWRVAKPDDPSRAARRQSV